LSKALAILFITILALSVVPVGAVTLDEARSDLAKAFVRVQNAEQAGYDVSSLVEELKTATGLLNAGGNDNLVQASALISDVLASTPTVTSSWIQAQNTGLFVRLALLAALGVIASLVWFYGSDIYWWLWRRTLRGWRVERI
jgi:hypothetical protein